MYSVKGARNLHMLLLNSAKMENVKDFLILVDIIFIEKVCVTKALIMMSHSLLTLVNICIMWRMPS